MEKNKPKVIQGLHAKSRLASRNQHPCTRKQIYNDLQTLIYNCCVDLQAIHKVDLQLRHRFTKLDLHSFCRLAAIYNQPIYIDLQRSKRAIYNSQQCDCKSKQRFFDTIVPEAIMSIFTPAK